MKANAPKKIYMSPAGVLYKGDKQQCNDKVQKIREEVARIQLYTQSEVLKQVLDYIDKVQEEPVSEQNLSIVQRTGKNWKEEPIIEVLDRYLDRVPDEEALKTKIAINEWFNVYFPKLQEEPVSIDFEQELYKAFGQVKDFTLSMQIAKWFYEMGKNNQEPVSKPQESKVDNDKPKENKSPATT